MEDIGALHIQPQDALQAPFNGLRLRGLMAVDTDRSFVVRIDGAPTLLRVGQEGLMMCSGAERTPSSDCLGRALAHHLVQIELAERTIRHLSKGVRARLLAVGPLVHFTSGSLEEAVVRAILRQVVRAPQARALTRRFLVAFGDECILGGETHYMFPPLTRLQGISARQLLGIGAGFKAKHICSALHALSDGYGEAIRAMSSGQAVKHLQRIPGIGAWTAGVAITDLRGDWSVYPIGDLAVRAAACHLWPEMAWPSELSAFRQAWRDFHGTREGVLAFYSLAALRLGRPAA